jgi:hypothetical protein
MYLFLSYHASSSITLQANNEIILPLSFRVCLPAMTGASKANRVDQATATTWTPKLGNVSFRLRTASGGKSKKQSKPSDYSWLDGSYK